VIEEIMEGTNIEEMITEEMTTEKTNVEDLILVVVIALIGIPHETEKALERILEKKANAQTLITVIVEELASARLPLTSGMLII